MIWLQGYMAVNMIILLLFMGTEWMGTMIRDTYDKQPGRVMATTLYISMLVLSIAMLPLLIVGATWGVVSHLRRRS